MEIKMRTFLVVICYLAISSIVGCAPESSDIVSINSISGSSVNERIQLGPPTGQVPLFNNGTILLMLRNISSNEVRFPVDFGIRVYYLNLNTKEWVQIGNCQSYKYSGLDFQQQQAYKKALEEGLSIFPKDSPYTKADFRFIHVTPVLEGLKPPITVRVIISGIVYKNSQVTNEKVVSYYDVLIDRLPCCPACCTEYGIGGNERNCMERSALTP